MLKHVKQLDALKKLGIVACLAMSSQLAIAEVVDIPSINPDEGRIGEVRRHCQTDNDTYFFQSI